MPRRARRSTRPRRRPVRRVARRRRTAMVEHAALKQTIQLKDDDQNTVYTYNTASLSGFDRAVQVARAYQYFRIVKIEYKFKPYADTYTPSATLSNATMPYLYWLINKGDVLDPVTFNDLRDAGSKPIRFDDKTLTVSWKPNVLMFNSNTRATPGTNPNFNPSKASPWLSTNDLAGASGATWLPSTLQHTGIVYGVESAISGTPEMIYGTEVTVHFEFKKPLSAVNPPAIDGKVAKVKETVARDA